MPDEVTLTREAMLGGLEVLKTAKNESLARYKPAAKQEQFHAAGKIHRERSLIAANQTGKTFCAAREVAFHLTGRYPENWNGRRWNRPTHWWAASITNEMTRDNPQSKLMGASKLEWGQGAIPKADIDFQSITLSRALGDLIDAVRIRHVSGGFSSLSFKSYTMGMDKWQGPTKDGVWFDEEPPAGIYSEGLTRTNLGNRISDTESGMTMLTLTPLLGMSEVVTHFYPAPDIPSRHLTQMDIWDMEGILYTKEQIVSIIAAYRPHERDARARGIPMMGTGRVFPVDEEFISCDSFKIPDDWKQIGGLDLGWDHPTAYITLAIEPAIGTGEPTFYVTSAYKQSEALIVVHAAAIKDRGDWIPVAWPHDGYGHEKDSGEPIASLYRKHGVNMLHAHATYLEGGYTVEPGCNLILDMMMAGRFKVFRHLQSWFAEFRQYHRAPPKNPKANAAPQIVKINDDLMSATRYAVMMSRFAREPKPKMFFNQTTVGMDFDPLGGRHLGDGRDAVMSHDPPSDILVRTTNLSLDFAPSPRVGSLTRAQADELAAFSDLLQNQPGNFEGQLLRDLVDTAPSQLTEFAEFNSENRLFFQGPRSRIQRSDIAIAVESGLLSFQATLAPSEGSSFAQFFTPGRRTAVPREGAEVEPFDPDAPGIRVPEDATSGFAGFFSFPELGKLLQESATGGSDIIPGLGGIPADQEFAFVSGQFVNTSSLQQTLGLEDLSQLGLPGSFDPETGEETPAAVFLREQLDLLTGEADPERRFRQKLRKGRGSTILGGQLGDVEILGGND